MLYPTYNIVMQSPNQEPDKLPELVFGNPRNISVKRKNMA